jgi:MSHA biogenesis protein MshP
MSPRANVTGMALIAAVFLITVLAVIAAAMVALTRATEDSSVKSMQSAKVYYGAKAGIEWAMQQAIPSNPPVCPASPTTLNLNQQALAGVTVVVTCNASVQGTPNAAYYITSVATIGTLGRPEYAERRMEATVGNF